MRSYALLFAVFFIFDWVLAIARFHSQLFSRLYNVINFPMVFPMRWLEGKNNEWWFGTFGTRFNLILNDEIAAGFVFLFFAAVQCMLQMLLVVLLWQGWKKVRGSSHN